ncbi:hypothetical protein [uncultured Helicobacter sp.]|uniref:hypothetical protein n=3 Tax=uncultured Helicobacter sp. TaxID=175537 RepID=UPI0025E1AC6C|nr:hypothetical protein [uncultured Helicobacter sp.]
MQQIQSFSQHFYEQYDRISSFFHIFINALRSPHSQTQLKELIKELRAIKTNDIVLLQSKPDGNALLVEIITILREKIYALFCDGHICGTEYFYMLLFVAHSPEGYVEVDRRFESFLSLAQENLFSQGNSDTENVLFIELYILSKALMNMCDFEHLVREYIMLIALVDINLSASLAHTQFIVDFFENLDVSMPTLLSSLKTLQERQTYLSYPPLARRSILNWQIHCFWNVSHFFNHHLWLELYPLWRDIFYALLEGGDIAGIDEAMYMQFFIYHMCGNNFHHQAQWRNFCAEIDSVAIKYYEAFSRTQGIYGVSKIHDNKSGKKCIGFLRDRLVGNSPYKVEYSLLSNLLGDEDFRQEYEVKIYTMKLFEKSVDDINVIRYYEALGIEVVDVVSPLNTKGFYNSHLQKALALKSAINRDNVCILISPNNGYGISDFIFASRSAPLQIYYSHGNFVYDLPCIDVKMTHICQNKRHIQHEGYDFYGVPVKMLERFYNPPLSAESQQEMQSLRATFPQNAIILGTIGRLMKLHSTEYWQCVVEIMRFFPQSIYLACGGGNSTLISECIMNVFESTQEGKDFLKRVYFMGYVDSGIYGHIIDIWLDSFPLEQGESRIEYTAKGGLSLMMSKQDELTRKQHLLAIVQKWQQIPHSDGSHKTDAECENALKILDEAHLPLIAFSQDEYISKAKDLLQLYAQGDTEAINAFKEAVAYARKITDEIKLYEGINAFKDIMALKPQNTL